MPATSHYLENYFRHNLANASWMRSRWDWIMLRPARCLLPTSGGGTIHCAPLLGHDERVADVGLDFPSFNPLFKRKGNSSWWYATAPSDAKALWYDTLIKVDAKARAVAAVFHEPGRAQPRSRAQFAEIEIRS